MYTTKMICVCWYGCQRVVYVCVFVCMEKLVCACTCGHVCVCVCVWHLKGWNYESEWIFASNDQDWCWLKLFVYISFRKGIFLSSNVHHFILSVFSDIVPVRCLIQLSFLGQKKNNYFHYQWICWLFS